MVVKKTHKNVKIEIWFIVVLYCYWQRVRVITLFQNIFSYCFCMLSEFAKVFERKVWRVQVAHLHNPVPALSSPRWCFQLPTNLGKDFFRYLWFCGKNSVNWMCFSVALVKFHWVEIWMQKLLPEVESGKYFQKWLFPRFWGKNGSVLGVSMHMQVILDSRFTLPGSTPLGGGKKGEFRDWTN